jgi:hypothetical protein
MASPARIDCRRCKHFYVTWEPKFPCGCHLFGFKSKTVPSIAVREATGAPCEHFVVKVKTQIDSPANDS